MDLGVYFNTNYLKKRKKNPTYVSLKKSEGCKTCTHPGLRKGLELFWWKEKKSSAQKVETIITAIVLGPVSSAAYLSDGDFHVKPALLSSRKYAHMCMHLRVLSNMRCLVTYTLHSILRRFTSEAFQVVLSSFVRICTFQQRLRHLINGLCHAKLCL